MMDNLLNQILLLISFILVVIFLKDIISLIVVLCLISFSVYWIFKKNNNPNDTITNELIVDNVVEYQS